MQTTPGGDDEDEGGGGPVIIDPKRAESRGEKRLLAQEIELVEYQINYSHLYGAKLAVHCQHAKQAILPAALDQSENFAVKAATEAEMWLRKSIERNDEWRKELEQRLANLKAKAVEGV